MANITLIGSGNTATTLGKALKAAGHKIVQVWSRNVDNAKTLAGLLDCDFTADIGAVNGDADIYLITVKDDAIEEIAGKIRLKDRIVAHTSGIRSKDLLRAASNEYGIFYPNVSMTKGVDVDLSTVLIMIEGSDEKTTIRLKALADSISSNAKVVTEKQRQSLHVAAVFANNFTNHFFVIAEHILEQNDLFFDDIKPMITAHFNNLMKQSPSKLQTGPGVRRDSTAIDSHLALIADSPELQSLYKMITLSIQEWNKERA